MILYDGDPYKACSYLHSHYPFNLIKINDLEHDVIRRLYSKIVEANDRIDKLESYLMDRDNFEDANDTDDEE